MGIQFSTAGITTIADIFVGDTFIWQADAWMVVTPKRTLLQSAVLQEIINRKGRIAVQLSSGHLAAWPGSTVVTPIDIKAEIVYKK